MKKCRFCAEEIQDEAIKCRYCGEFLDDSHKPKPQTKWYYSPSAVVIGLLTVGPFALPLVWAHPKYKLNTKIVVTIVVIAVTIVAIMFTIWLFKIMGPMLQQMSKQLNEFGIH